MALRQVELPDYTVEHELYYWFYLRVVSDSNGTPPSGVTRLHGRA